MRKETSTERETKSMLQKALQKKDWLDDVTKIPQWRYVPAGLNPIVDIMNSVWGRAVLGTGDLRRSERYQKAYEYLKNHPEIDTLEGHSFGGDVVLHGKRFS